MNPWRWVKWRWTEARWGMGNYLSPAATAINTVLLVQLYLGDKGLVVPLLILSAFVLAATGFGLLHRKIQQDTDALLQNRAVLEAFKLIIAEPGLSIDAVIQKVTMRMKR